RIGFYSDRSGVYDLWTIRPDGSELTQLTKSAGNPGFPTWSPDGSRVAFGYLTWHIIEPKAAPITGLSPEPAISPTERFGPMSWSPDGRRLAGPVLPLGGYASSLGIYTLATRQFSRLPGEFGAPSAWFSPVWLA